MSCRAMGEESRRCYVLETLMEFSKEVNAKIIKAEIIPTKKNRPTFDIFNNSYF